MEPEQVGDHARNKVRLGLKHTINGTSNVFEINEETAETQIGKIAPNQDATLQILGIAGTKKEDGGDQKIKDVEDNGATDKFTMTFKIKKSKA